MRYELKPRMQQKKKTVFFFSLTVKRPEALKMIRSTHARDWRELMVGKKNLNETKTV